MINTCAQCGSYRPDKEIRQNPSRAICPDCGHSQPFLQLPLFIVCGTNGAGKSAVCRQLQQANHPFVPLKTDILYRTELSESDTSQQAFQEMWLRVCKNIGQAGKPVVLFHAGGLPQHIEPCVERRYFSAVHYLALVAADDVIVRRLKAHPTYRGYTPENIADQVAFNQWLRREGPHRTPAITLLDTTNATISETSTDVLQWMKAQEPI